MLCHSVSYTVEYFLCATSNPLSGKDIFLCSIIFINFDQITTTFWGGGGHIFVPIRDLSAVPACLYIELDN